MPKIIVGEWVCTNLNGICASLFTGAYSWKSKKEAVEDMSAAKLDAARKPLVKRISKGRYEYIPKNCDTLRYMYGSSYTIEQLTHRNIEHYLELIAAAEAEEAEDE